MKKFAFRFFAVLACLFFLSVLPSCAPKKIKVYDVPEGVRANVVQIALSQQGKKYRSGNKGPDYFDCSGLVYYAYRQAGINMPLTADGQGKYGADIPRDAVQPGDLVLFKIKSDDHIGIMVNRSDFVHASKSRGVTLDSLGSAYWRKYIIGFRSVL